MNSDFFDTSGGGDLAGFQHLFWYFGHPESWLMVFIWFMVLVGVVSIALRLWKTGRRRGLALFLAAVGVVLFIYIKVLRAAFHGFVEGRVEEFVPVQTANGLLAVCALLITVWLLVDRIKSSRAIAPSSD